MRGLPRKATAADAESLERLRAVYEGLRVAWGTGPAEISLSSRRLTGGMIRYGHPHAIVISLHMPEDERLETLLHETAHAVCWARDGNAREKHGRRFWSIARALGVSRRSAPETDALARHRAERAKHLYRCEGCGQLWRRFRPFRRSVVCIACHRAKRPARILSVRVPKGR